MEHAGPEAAAARVPVDGLRLLRRQAARRDALRRSGNCLTGCEVLDGEVLAGGLERGCVVGVSAEQEDFGLLLGLQTIARPLVHDAWRAGQQGGSGTAVPRNRPRVLIVTTMAMGELLPTLRRVLEDQAGQLLLLVGEEARALAAGCLEQISISRVFDFEGLWEVLHEDLAPVVWNEGVGEEMVDAEPCVGLREDAPAETGAVKEPPMRRQVTLPALRPTREKTEIQDSEDEEALSMSDESCGRSSSPPQEPTKDLTTAMEEEQAEQSSTPRPISPTPEIILVTHMATLLGTLFRHHHDKQAPHRTMASLSSRLRRISRSAEHGKPLILLLNTTNAGGWRPNEDRPAAPGPPAGWNGDRGGGGGGAPRPLDPSLRSIFNQTRTQAAAAADETGSRRIKPAYGLVFTQALDVHLLATLVARATEGRYCWVVEVLLDEIGAWTEGGQGTRVCREQRWTAVQVRGPRLEDADLGHVDGG